MLAALRLPALLALGLLLLLGCGNGQTGREAAPDSRPPNSATSGPSADPVNVTMYNAKFTLTASGNLTVVETLTLDVRANDRHGIYRVFDPADAVEGFTATLDGHPTSLKAVVVSNERGFRIGDPTRTLKLGEHVARMEYRVADVLPSPSAGGLWFDWQLIPPNWDMKIQSAKLTVNLPTNASRAVCTIGKSQPCDVVGSGTRTLSITTGGLPKRTPVRLRSLELKP